jgi:glycosyltransferase involved in cell wall biosynthesis
MKKSKPRLALFGVGSLGGMTGMQGNPLLTDLVERLSADFEIVYYTFSKVSLANIPKDIKVRQLIPIRFPWRLKYLFLFIRALADHFHEPFSLLFSVSVYPTGLFSLILGRVIRRPVLVQLIATEAAKVDGIRVHLTVPWLKRITKIVCAKADVLVVVSDYQKERAIVDLPTSRQIEVLPKRVNPKKFIYRKRKLTYPVQFIQVAYYSPLKDQDAMFRAFSLVVQKIDCRLTVVGEGFNVPKVQTMLKDLSISEKVNCVGFVSQSELPQYYDNAHILLHTSRFEGCCAVIQEAMASGVAVCGTNVGILNDIGDRYAVITPARDPEKLAEAILKLVNDPMKYESITVEAYQWITQYDAEWSAKNYKALIDKYI